MNRLKGALVLWGIAFVMLAFFPFIFGYAGCFIEENESCLKNTFSINLLLSLPFLFVGAYQGYEKFIKDSQKQSSFTCYMCHASLTDDALGIRKSELVRTEMKPGIWAFINKEYVHHCRKCGAEVDLKGNRV
jgi:hypothetical protein